MSCFWCLERRVALSVRWSSHSGLSQQYDEIESRRDLPQLPPDTLNRLVTDRLI